ncbi:sugar phosphate isomerase/epimerase family protein [Actinopolymorpha alba]|uniref:sugar phosphate isomerase/epimerase family protein n=1 Tax=Actinopolymorpha alba TaxID=533267 RepID=UPI00037FA567|nr:sugar phosphate isomerase/epimerase [Actinopolymorpha alba]
MRYSLSVRIAESPRDKTEIVTSFPALAAIAREQGYAGVCLRASVVSVDSPPEQVRAVREAVVSSQLEVSMITGDIHLAANDERASAMLRDIDPYLNLAETLGARLIRVALRSPADIPYARRAAERAARRGLVLAHQLHWGTLFETVEAALDTLAEIDRPEAFGITYEPANLLLCGQEWKPAIERLAPFLVNAYYSNAVLTPDGPLGVPTNPDVRFRYAPIDDPDGISLVDVLSTLRTSGYDGWFTVHQPLLPGQNVAQAAADAAAAIQAARADS